MFQSRKIGEIDINRHAEDPGGKRTEEEKDSNTVVGIWENFTQTTGFHGVNKITFKTKCPRQIIRSTCWITVWLVCAVYLTYTVITELKNYYSYPFISNTFVQFHDLLAFPAVTVCNLSPRKRSAFSNDTKTTNLYMRTSGMYIFSHSINWTDPFYAEKGYFEEQTMETISNESKNLWGFLYLAGFDNHFYTYPEIQKMFKLVLTDMGLCLRANEYGNMDTSMHGALFNMHLYINVMTYEDYFSHSISSGVKIAIHDHKTEPIMVNEGIAIKPASEAFVEIKRKEVGQLQGIHKFLPPPYTAFGNKTCVDLSSYSFSKCYQKCWSTIVENLCGCRDFLSEGNGSYCSYHDYLTCSNPIFWKLLTTYNVEQCNCPSECHVTTYDYSFSTGSYPSNFVGDQLVATLGLPKSYIRENFVLIKIYYKHLTTTVTEQIPKYQNAGDIFANLGGQLGLFLGASILTITELLEFLVFLVYILINRFTYGRQRSEET